MLRNSQLNINYTDCKDCENYNYNDNPCDGCIKHEYFAAEEPICKDDYEWFLSNEHTRKTWKKTKKGKWSIFPMYNDNYDIDKQLTDMEFKRQNWS